MPEERAARDGLHAALAAALAFALQLPIFDRWMSLMDEGHILQFADLLSHGGELYRDATLLPLPGAFYLLALAFRIFGDSVLVARWIVVVEFALLCALSFLILRRLVPRPAAWLGVLAMGIYRVWAFPHWQMYSYSTTSVLFLAATLLFVMRFLESGSRRALVGAGLLNGLAILCKQDYGAAGFVAMNVVLFASVRTGPKRDGPGWLAHAVRYAAPAAILGAVLAAHYLAQGLFLEMLRQTVLNHLVGIATFEYPSLPPILPLFEQEPLFRGSYGYAVYVPAILFSVDWGLVSESALYTRTFLWDLAIKLVFYAPYLMVVGGGLRLFRRRAALSGPGRPRFLHELALWALATALIAAFNKPVDYVHLMILCWPFVLLLCVWTHAGLRALRGHRRLVLGAALVLAVTGSAAVGYTARLAWRLRTMHTVDLRGDRAGVKVTAAEEEVIGGAVDYMRENSDPGEPVAVLPYFPLLNFLAERPGPHRSTYVLWPVEDVPNREAEIAAAMDRAETDIAIYHVTQWQQFTRMEEFAPDLFRYLVERYEIDRVFSDVRWGYMITGLRRSPGPPPGRPLVGEDAEEGTLRVVSAEGRTRIVPRGRRDHFLRPALWPFRPVLMLRPAPEEGARTVLSLPIAVPESGGRLVTAVGVHPAEWFRYPPSAVTFRIDAVADGRSEELFARVLDPHVDRADRGWVEVEIPLDRYAGRRISLELSTQTVWFAAFRMGGFAIPRLVTEAAAAATGPAASSDPAGKSFGSQARHGSGAARSRSEASSTPAGEGESARSGSRSGSRGTPAPSGSPSQRARKASTRAR